MDMGNIELASLRYSGWGGDKGRGRVKSNRTGNRNIPNYFYDDHHKYSF